MEIKRNLGLPSPLPSLWPPSATVQPSYKKLLPEKNTLCRLWQGFHVGWHREIIFQWLTWIQKYTAVPGEGIFSHPRSQVLPLLLIQVHSTGVSPFSYSAAPGPDHWVFWTPQFNTVRSYLVWWALLERVGIETFWLHLHMCSSHVLRSTDHNMLPRHSWSPRLLLPPRPSSLSFPLSLCLNAITCSESEQLASLKHALRLTQSPQAPIITSALRSLALMN